MNPPDDWPDDQADANEAPAWSIPAVVFARGRLSPAERAAVAARPRFYSMAWLVPAGTPPTDPDDLLFP